MKHSIKTLIESLIQDDREQIINSKLTIAEYLTNDLENIENGYSIFLTDEEIEEDEKNKDEKNKNEVREFFENEFNYYLYEINTIEDFKNLLKEELQLSISENTFNLDLLKWEREINIEGFPCTIYKEGICKLYADENKITDSYFTLNEENARIIVDEWIKDYELEND